GDDELTDPAPGEQDHEAHQQAYLCHGEQLGWVPDPGVVPAHQPSEQRHENGADRPLPDAKPRRPAGGHREETRRHLGPVPAADAAVLQVLGRAACRGPARRWRQSGRRLATLLPNAPAGSVSRLPHADVRPVPAAHTSSTALEALTADGDGQYHRAAEWASP